MDINQTTNINRNADIKDIVQFLNQQYKDPNFDFPNNMELIKYYMITEFVQLPPNLNLKYDRILTDDIKQNPILDVNQIKDEIHIIKFDITQIKADAIVNAANAIGCGCFQYGHKCVDNVIHSKSGPCLRLQCSEILNGSKIQTGYMIVTNGFNLPAKYVIHTVGPIYDQLKHEQCVNELKLCYSNCLKIAVKNQLNSIVFPCISTGLYGFPQKLATHIAIETIMQSKIQLKSDIKVIFCTYTEQDYQLYKNFISNH